MDTTKKSIVVIGGSYGGVSTAHYLLKHVIPALKPNCYEVVLISAASQAMCRPACPRAMISDELLPQEKLFVDIAKQFEPYEEQTFRFIHGRVVKLDHKERRVDVELATNGQSMLNYHAVVIATGANTLSPLLGLNKDEISLRQSWAEFRQALLTAKKIVIAGGGPTGIEVAGELGDHLNGRAGWFQPRLNDPKVSITVISGQNKILPQLRESIAAQAEEYLAKHGVVVMKGVKAQLVSPEGAGVSDVAKPCKVTLSDGQILGADLYIPAYGTIPNSGFLDKQLLESDGRVRTNSSTLRVDDAGERVYALGDVSSAARPAVHIVLEAVPVVCANMRRDLLIAEGRGELEMEGLRVFKEDTRETQMVPIGKNKGVGAAMGYKMPSILVWLIKGRDYWLWTTGKLWSGDQWTKAK